MADGGGARLRLVAESGKRFSVPGRSACDRRFDSRSVYYSWQGTKEKSETEARLRGLFAPSPIGITLNDFDTGAFVEVSGGMVAQTGYATEEILKLSCRDVMPTEYAKLEAMPTGAS
jgi:PAS domain-containing protein